MAKLFDFTLADLHDVLNNRELREEFEAEHEDAGVREYLDHALVLGDAGRENLNYVVENGDAEDTEIILAIRKEETSFDGGMDQDELNDALFHITAPEQIDVLTSAGAEIDAQRSHPFGDAWTPVMEAIELGREEVAISFISKGADLSCDWLTVNAIDLASDMGSHAVVKAIEGQQAHLDAQFLDGNTVEAAGAWSPSQADADALVSQASRHEVSQQRHSRRL